MDITMKTNVEEIWKPVKDYPNYEVSNYGRVKHIDKDYILKPCVDSSVGYIIYRLTGENGVSYKKYGHRLVAEAFISNPEHKRLVNHIDCDKTNNFVENLEWATDSENMKHAFANGLCENTRKSALVQQRILASKPRTERQIETARENIIKSNKLPKTEKQLEASIRNLNSDKCRQAANEKHINRHLPIRVIETGEVNRSQRELSRQIDINESAICACLHGRRNQANGLHFEYISKEEYESIKEKSKQKSQPLLREHQADAVKRMFNGCILNGGVGSGKSITGLYYYFSQCGGSIDPDYIPMKHPKDLYIISTAKKRNDMEWEGELVRFRMSTHPELNTLYNNKIVVDSWQNIKKYVDIKDAFFIFDEDHVTGYGAWTKAFLKITKSNSWIILSATAGDRWEDFIPVFIANGFYRNKTEFVRRHIQYSQYTKYPKVERYHDTTRLMRLRDRILIDMDFHRHTIPHHEDVYCKYDMAMYKDTIRRRWDPYKNEPIQQAAGLCYTLRKIVNSDESRQVALLELFEKHPRMIVFYSFDYERDILLNLAYGEDVEVAEYSGHAHQPIPDSNRWVYLVNYSAGAEGFNCIKTDCIVFYSQNYSYKTLEQARGRIDRLNTPYIDLYYYYLKSRSGIDLAISKALRNKKKFNENRWCNSTVWDK